MHKVCTKAILLGERSVRIREVKGSNPSRSTFSSSVILTLLLFFCIITRARQGRSKPFLEREGFGFFVFGGVPRRTTKASAAHGRAASAQAQCTADAYFLCLKNFGRPCRAPNPEVGCEPGGVINVLFENPSLSRLFLCILQSAVGKRIAFMPPSRKFLQKFPHHRRLIQPWAALLGRSWRSA